MWFPFDWSIELSNQVTTHFHVFLFSLLLLIKCICVSMHLCLTIISKVNLFFCLVRFWLSFCTLSNFQKLLDFNNNASCPAFSKTSYIYFKLGLLLVWHGGISGWSHRTRIIIICNLEIRYMPTCASQFIVLNQQLSCKFHGCHMWKQCWRVFSAIKPMQKWSNLYRPLWRLSLPLYSWLGRIWLFHQQGWLYYSSSWEPGPMSK